MKAPAHPRVELVREGRAGAVVFVADRHPSANLKRLVDELVEAVRLGTGLCLDQLGESGDAQAHQREAATPAARTSDLLLESLPQQASLLGTGLWLLLLSVEG